MIGIHTNTLWAATSKTWQRALRADALYFAERRGRLLDCPRATAQTAMGIRNRPRTTNMQTHCFKPPASMERFCDADSPTSVGLQHRLTPSGGCRFAAPPAGKNLWKVGCGLSIAREVIPTALDGMGWLMAYGPLYGEGCACVAERPVKAETRYVGKAPQKDCRLHTQFEAALKSLICLRTSKEPVRTPAAHKVSSERIFPGAPLHSRAANAACARWRVSSRIKIHSVRTSRLTARAKACGRQCFGRRIGVEGQSSP